MKNKIVKSICSLGFLLALSFILMPEKVLAKTTDIGGPYDPPIEARCEGASGHCLTYGDVMYYGRIKFNNP